MLKEPIYISAYSSISPLGSDKLDVWSSYNRPETLINNTPKLKADLATKEEGILQQIKNENTKYKGLDRSVLMTLAAGRKAIDESGWKASEAIGINIGSSRGATELFENFHKSYLEHQQTHPLTSPTTTLGNISSWLANDLQINGPLISHSITCSTALHSVLNAVAWLNSGMSNKFIVGGAEAANTDFTIAQMEALKIYSPLNDDPFPCRSLDFNKTKNTMVLGEGAAIFALENTKSKSNQLCIKSIGYGTEIVKHNASISEEAECFKLSMKQALNGMNGEKIDAIVMHAPGTIKGDESELKAIQSIFEKTPALTSNKWKIGHSLGASGALSLEMALMMIEHQTFIENPFFKIQNPPKNLNNIMVNAVGFGGNAVSIVVGTD